MQKLLPYFSFAGRTNRQPYWVTSILIYLAFLVAGLVSMGIPIVGLILGLPTLIVGLWAAFAVAVRRLHDRNKSGWWLLAIYLPSLLFSAMREIASQSSPAAGAFFGLLGVPFAIWAFVELGCLRGTKGPNRFGDDPLAQSTAEVFS